MTLTEFLLARIAEDEEIARLAVDAELTFATRHGQKAIPPSDLGRHWLAECEAKRRIVERRAGAMSAAYQVEDASDGEWESFEGNYSMTRPEFLAERDTHRLLALPYASHPDYREEWKP